MQNRGGKGVKAGIFNEKTGKLVNLKLITPNDDVMLIADTGIIIRIRSEEISKIGRTTQGVRIMRLGEGKIATVAIAPHEDEEKPEGEDVQTEEVFTEEGVAVVEQTETEQTEGQTTEE